MPQIQDIAIQVDNVFKQFRIPHEKHATLKAAALNLFNKKRYTEFRALDKVSFEVKKGEFFGVVGRNGSGKSTLLKIIAGIYVPTKGKVKIKGRISPFLELGVGFNPELTARENVYLNGTILGLTRKEIDEKYDEIIQFAELEEFVDLKIKNFSSGMQVRLAFSVAIRAHAEILLIDEVLAVGDANFQEKCIREFARFKGEGRTILFVTHAMDLVERFCDRALLLDNGKIADLGNPKKIALEYGMLNVLEEEKKENEENCKGGTVKKGNRKIEIYEVEGFDKNGERKTIFHPGDEVNIKINYDANGSVEKPVFGAAFFNEAGVYVAGLNTKTSGLCIDKLKGKGSIELKINNIPFLQGSYRVAVKVFDWEMVNILEYKNDAYSFGIEVKEKEYDDGIVVLDTTWKC